MDRGGVLMRIFPIAAVLAIPAALLCQSNLPVGKVRQIEQMITTEMARNSIPGLSVAVGNSSGLRWSNGYGMADLENLVPVTPLTEIRLGSISKPITATAVMQLVERGKIRLDDPIQEYVSSYPRKAWPVTVRQLLGHLGGVRHYRAEEIDSTKHYASLADGLKLFADDPLLFEPGTQYSYSTYGFNLLGAAVESASHMAFVDYLRQNIFGPAGMTHIGPDNVFAIIPHRSRGYRLSAAKQLENCGLADTSYKIPGGGIISTAEDLVTFGLALNTGKLVKPETRDLMFTAQEPRSGKSAHYGIGWTVGEFQGRRAVSHGGGQQGISTFLLLLPDDNIAVAVMLNRERAPAADITRKMAEVVLQ
jgi:CubicO group peptidase (beta-lactamase class C family)